MEIFFCGAPDAPEDQVICLFAGLLANPDMALSLNNLFPIHNLYVPIRFGRTIRWTCVCQLSVMTQELKTQDSRLRLRLKTFISGVILCIFNL